MQQLLLLLLLLLPLKKEEISIRLGRVEPCKRLATRLGQAATRGRQQQEEEEEEWIIGRSYEMVKAV